MAFKIPGLETYFGGKNGPGVYQAIINEIPPHRAYIEPFLGSGAIMRHKKLACMSAGIDKDKEVIRLWKAANPKHINLHCGCALKLLADATITNETFIYCDPPYPILARETKRKVYRCEMEDREHIELLDLVSDMAGMVCISSYRNPLYDERLKGWRTKEFIAQTRKGNALEVLYMNYPQPTELHDYSFYGDTKRKRQDYKKKVNGYLSKFNAMDPIERAGILNEIHRMTNSNPHME